MRALRVVWLTLVFFGLVSLIGFSSASSFHQLIENGDLAYERWSGGDFDFNVYRGKLKTAINYYRKALPLIPDGQVRTKKQVLNRLSRAYFELSHAYLKDRSQKANALAKGKDYGLESLRFSREFRELEEKKGLEKALQRVTDVMAVFFYGNNLGEYLNFNWGYALSGGTKRVKVLFKRSIELDEKYLGGGPHRALAAFLARTPEFLGGDFQASKKHFERSIQLGPNFLENYVNYAEYYGKKIKDWELFCRNLDSALRKAQNEAVMKEWPLYNTLAVRRANQLFKFEYKGKPVCGA